jgi:hypothetical protein
MDMIGPWTLEVGDRTEKFSALTIIDLVTTLVEIVRVNNKTTAAVTAHFVNAWLACYPKPMSCVHDPGSEFLGWNFQEMLHRNNILSRWKPTSKCDLRTDASIHWQQPKRAKTIESSCRIARHTCSSRCCNS